MNLEFSSLSIEQCRSARLARDLRFDGLFYVAVKTTGIFCRPICPAVTPKEKNVEYYSSQALALQAGYRPCLRCRPDSAPGSCAWRGVETTLQRALHLVSEGALHSASVSSLAERLGISDRYLRKLFETHMGLPIKKYAQYQQLMFAKQLLRESQMSVNEIAIASGFNSVRRFNDAFSKLLKLTPSHVRKGEAASGDSNHLNLHYRAPYDWEYCFNFYRQRLMHGIEEVGLDTYQRTFTIGEHHGWFKLVRLDDSHITLEFSLDSLALLQPLVARVRRTFDLDADSRVIDQHLKNAGVPVRRNGIRIPGVWDLWEAGVRAILGQQITLKSAIKLLNTLTENLASEKNGKLYFPSPAVVANSQLEFLKMPKARRETLKQFANVMLESSDREPETWLELKGIGNWTVNYVKLRAQSLPDMFLSTDAVVAKAIRETNDMDTRKISPWGSYATLHCWEGAS